ncbi:MAG: efflux RND transporter periplasmic adaptor subunit, partial [Acidobacteriaceae bacterium]
KAGQPLMLLDPSKQQATVNSAEATVEQQKAQAAYAKTNLDRVQALYNAKVVAKQDLDNAQTAYNSAVANLNSLHATVNAQATELRYYTIRAGGDGTVGDIPVKVGDHVVNTTLLTTLDTGAGLEDYISIPTERASEVKLGTPVQILTDDGTPVDTKITFVSPRVDPASQLLLVKAAVPAGDKRFRNMQVVHTRIIWKQIQAVLVPVLSVSRQSNAIFAFVVGKNDKGQDIADQVSLTTSSIQGNDYVVEGGLKPGDQLIVSGVNLLAQGVPVKPLAGAPPGQTNAAAAAAAGSPSVPETKAKSGRAATAPGGAKGTTNAQGTR